MPSKPPPPRPAARLDAVPKKSNMLNLHWKVTKEAPAVHPSSKDSGFMAKVSQLAAAFTPSSSSDSSGCNAEARQSDAASASTATPALQDTVFASAADVKALPTPLLEVYFKARNTQAKMASDTSGQRPALMDKKFLEMLGIAMQKHVMANKGQSKAAAVLSLKRAVLQCDYDIVPQEFLAIFRIVLAKHREEGSEVTKLVEKSGEAALLQLKQAVYHQMIHELLKVPQIEERLECMLFETDFQHSSRKCSKHLEVLKQALEALDGKRELLGKFFSTALRLGQGLNRESRAPLAPRGFQLSSLDKLAQTKSTKSPKHNMLHFVLALMLPEDAEQLFTAEDRAVLGKAKSTMSYSVYKDSIELVQGFYGVREICETGNYKKIKMERRRKTMAPRSAPSPDEAADSGKENEAPIDIDDKFHDAMKAFVDRNFRDAQGIAEGCLNVFHLYKNLALFFDDFASVWPPPRDETGAKIDLVGVFYNLAEQVMVHREEVEQDGLRVLLQPPPPPPVAAPAVVVATTSEVSACAQAQVMAPANPKAKVELHMRVQALPGKELVHDGTEYYREGDEGTVTKLQGFNGESERWEGQITWDRTGRTSAVSNANWGACFRIIGKADLRRDAE
jgi:hypothetical protein